MPLSTSFQNITSFKSDSSFNSRGLGLEFCFLLFLVGLLFKQNGDIRAECFPGWQHGRETGLN